MTRDECIEAMARARHSEACDGGYAQVGYLNATAAYDAMAEHIQAREEAVREMCAVYCHSHNMSVNVRGSEGTYVPTEFNDKYGTHPGMGYADAIRALDIGGKTDG